MVVFAPNYGRWWGPTNGTLSFYESRLSGGDTQTLPVIITLICTFNVRATVGKFIVISKII